MDEGTKGQDQTIGFWRAAHFSREQPDLDLVQDRHGGIVLHDKDLDACIDHFRVQETRGACEDRRDRGRFHRGTTTLDGLRVSQLTDDLGPAAFWPFLLRNRIIGAPQSGLTTIGARLLAVASDLSRMALMMLLDNAQSRWLATYLPAVATIAGSFRLIRHCLDSGASRGRY